MCSRYPSPCLPNLTVAIDHQCGPSGCTAHTTHPRDHDALCHAGGPEIAPVTVYEDLESPENSIKCYLGVSGCIGDVPFTAMVASACGHTCKKGCKFCFLMGQTTNDLDEALRAVRSGGYNRDVTSTKAQKFDNSANWVDVRVCFSAEDGTFDETFAKDVKVTPDLHAMRVQAAQDVRDEARAQHPPPPQPANGIIGSSAMESWSAGVTCLGAGHAISVYRCLCLSALGVQTAWPVSRHGRRRMRP